MRKKLLLEQNIQLFDRLAAAESEIKRLKKALDLEKMRSAGYSHMIELAEQQFNIPIRKKSGTKQ